MNRNHFVSLTVLSLLALSATPTLAAPEPVYTATLPGNQTLSLRIESTKTRDGRRKIRVWNQPRGAAKSDIELDTTVTLEASGRPSASRVFIGANPDIGMYLEATQNGSGYMVREPALSGDLRFGATLFTPLLAELFIGRQYDFKRGGPQTFAQLFDSFVSTAKVETLILTAEGKPEKLALTEGPVMARKLRYQRSGAVVPEPMRTGVFYVGLQGEVLKCDTSFFGIPLLAKGPAVWEDAGRRLLLRFQNLDSADRVVALQADKQSGGDWKMKLGFEGQTESLPTLTCDSAYRLKHLETPWHGRPFVASIVTTDTVRWTLAGGPEQQVSIPADSPVWFLPHWFVTDLWEGSGGAFAGMTVDETRDGFLLPLAFGQRDAATFTLERLADFAKQGASGAAITLHHYRLYTGGKGANPPQPRYDIYTDGARLTVFLSSDGIKIIRNGWEGYAATLTPPTATVEPVPAPAAPVPPEADKN